MLRSFVSALDCTRSSSANSTTTAIIRTPISRRLLPARKSTTSKIGLNADGSAASTMTPSAIAHEMNRFRRLIWRRRYRRLDRTKKPRAAIAPRILIAGTSGPYPAGRHRSRGRM